MCAQFADPRKASIGNHVEIVDAAGLENIHDVLESAKPVLLKGAISDWPAVAACSASDQIAVEYFQKFATDEPVDTMLGDPDMKGHFFFGDDVRKVNFKRGKSDVSTILTSILDQSNRPEHERSTVYVGAAPTKNALAGFSQENQLDLVAPSIEPRICIGSPVTVQAHFDLVQNVACLVAGHRRFTLFPPSQLKNLYLAPIEHTLAGPPVSMVRPEAPDFEKYPRFEEALKHALHADLEPGDALYIPYFWWHHVQSFAPLNILINYWWNEPKHELGSPFNALLHTLLTVRDLPPSMREGWQAMYEHFVFEGQEQSPMGHVPEETQGGLGAHDQSTRARLWMMLANGVGNTAKSLLPKGRR